MIVAIVIASHVPSAAKYAREHFFPASQAVVVARDEREPLYGIAPSVPVYVIDGYAVFKFPNVLAWLLERGHTILNPRDAGVALTV